MKAFEYRHTVSFEETNLLGNVYFTNYFLWQGKCREMFLHEFVPSLVAEFQHGLYLATTKSQCEFIAETFVFDEIIVKMRLLDLSPSRITMGFEYLRVKTGVEELIARGEQQVVCMRRNGERVEVAEVPLVIRTALKQYQDEQ